MAKEESMVCGQLWAVLDLPINAASDLHQKNIWYKIGYINYK